MNLTIFPALAAVALLTGCTHGIGIGVPFGPFSVGFGVSSGGGLTAGVATAYGPLGAGVSVNQSGQVIGSTGIGASVPLGGTAARVGVGVGTGTVLYDPSHGPGIPILRSSRVLAPRPAEGAGAP